MALTDQTQTALKVALGSNNAGTEIAGLFSGATTITAQAVTALTATSAAITTGTVTTLVNTAHDMSAAAATQTVKANTAAALGITDGSTTIIGVDTRNTVTGVSQVTITGPAPTIAGAAGTTFNVMSIAPITLTTSTTTGITALDGIGLKIGTPTVNQSGGAVTVTTMSTLYVSKPVAGSSVTGTNKYIINTDQSGCFCTAAGVWTDTASTRRIKQKIADATPRVIMDLIDNLRPRTWEYNPDEVGNDFGRQRYGIVSEELPECFRIPGIDNDQGGLSGSIIGSFALAALKLLYDRNQELEGRLAKLEAAA